MEPFLRKLQPRNTDFVVTTAPQKKNQLNHLLFRFFLLQPWHSLQFLYPIITGEEQKIACTQAPYPTLLATIPRLKKNTQIRKSSSEQPNAIMMRASSVRCCCCCWLFFVIFLIVVCNPRSGSCYHMAWGPIYNSFDRKYEDLQPQDVMVDYINRVGLYLLDVRCWWFVLSVSFLNGFLW